jgi:hypothetical protein
MRLKKNIIICLILVIGPMTGFGQILFTESFNIITDTTKFIKGNIMPDFKFQTQKENLLEIDNLADITLRIKKNNAITLANKIELSKFGSQVFLSGGYLYGEYRRIMENDFVIEPYAQVHWAEARGMERKYAVGANLRYRILNQENIHLFAGIGPFYEFERWNYRGVPDSVVLPPDRSPIISRQIKLGSYISLKWNTSEKISFDLGAYHQARFDQLFSTPRLATSVMTRITLTKHIGFNMAHQFIYDYQPIVPVRKDFHRVILGFALNF